ncbi:unnamed protein product [Rangifer tarandus platyrhynchus]|uniref:Uncharacterized protein n=2 Tax=Rangifer tarandus platyrhynchus TaxID=3082113 RepID=A0ACB0F1E2_RANTA|nr:unnamed protein product [Rangifer tarandus platyrhynchus]CAI9706021.1 unnamed protein product [Rangifer tarandus platyrhynchus]
MFSADVRKRVPASGTCFGARPRRFDPQRSRPALWAPADRDVESRGLRPLWGSYSLRPLPAWPRGALRQDPAPRVGGERAGCAQGHQRNGERALPGRAGSPTGHGPRVPLCPLATSPWALGGLPSGGTQRVSPTALCSGGLPSRPASGARPP